MIVSLIMLFTFAMIAAVGFTFIAARPEWAAYIFLATMPFVGGIDRGSIIPLVRPSEAIQVALTLAVLAGALFRYLRGAPVTIRFTKLDRSLLVLAALSSIWPLFWLFARNRLPSSADFFETFIVWRLAALYVLYRCTVRTPEQLRKCLWILLVSASLLAVLAILDSLGIYKMGGIWRAALDTDSAGRGGATLNSPIAVGDYLAYSLAVVLVWIFRQRASIMVLGGIAGIILLGSLGTGQFSAWIGAFVAVVVVAHYEGKLAKMPAYLGPVAIVGAIVAWPVISTRLQGFKGGSSLPSSWLGRYDNIAHIYMPMMGHFRWVLGLRPDSTLVAPETWRQFIWLESGYLKFLWVGGIPLLLGFIWFARTVFRQTNQVARTRSDDIGVAALAARAAMWSIVILGLIDIHLTLRGGGDLFFVLLGLSSNLLVKPPAPSTELAVRRWPELTEQRRYPARVS